MVSCTWFFLLLGSLLFSAQRFAVKAWAADDNLLTACLHSAMKQNQCRIYDQVQALGQVSRQESSVLSNSARWPNLMELDKFWYEKSFFQWLLCVRDAACLLVTCMQWLNCETYVLYGQKMGFWPKEAAPTTPLEYTHWSLALQWSILNIGLAFNRDLNISLPLLYTLWM